VGGEGILMCFFAFGIGGAVGSGFFELSMESKAIFTLGRAWSIVSLLNKSKVDCSLVKGNRSRNEACDSTNIGVGILVGLTGLAMRVKSLINSGGQ
jgi:hypothetical protein